MKRRILAAALALCMAFLCLACGDDAEKTEGIVFTGLELTNLKATQTTYDVREGVTEIGKYAFHMQKLKSITIPDTVTKIDAHAFESCKKLKNITLSSALTEIGECAFKECKTLKSITIPDKVAVIGANAFEDCEKLEEVVLPSALTEIGEYVFTDCERLESVTIPDTVTKIGAYAFKGCRSLQTVTLPSALQTIGEGAFRGCSALKKIVLPENAATIPDEVLAECFRPDVSLFVRGADAWIPERFDGAAEDFNTTPLFADGEPVRIIPLGSDGSVYKDLYSSMPASLRTLDPEEADYALIRTVEHVDRSSRYVNIHSGGVIIAMATETRIYLCAKDGTATLLFYSISEPPASGTSPLYGEVATTERIWQKIGGRFE